MSGKSGALAIERAGEHVGTDECCRGYGSNRSQMAW